jgi:leucyl aminopeptidase
MAIKFKSKVGSIISEKAEVQVLPVFEDTKILQGSLDVIDRATKGLIKNLLTSGDFLGERYKTFMLYPQRTLSAKRIVLVGLGKKKNFDLDVMRGAGGKAFQYVRDLGIKTIHLTEDLLEAKGFSASKLLEAFLTGGSLGVYRFGDLITTGREKIKEVDECVIVSQKKSRTKNLEMVLRHVTILREAVYIARDLVSLPANKKTPAMLAHQAQAIAKNNTLQCRVITEEQAQEMGMGAFLAVAQGSREPGKIIILEYTASRNFGPPLVIIGKGITFDSGGISLKPPDKMEQMKDDMAGGAVVMGTMQAVAQMKLPLNLVGIIPAAENLPGGKAYKPGDVLTSLSGQTIEVISTDAEGRLILADALTYAKRYKPKAIFDLATLTGACITALGDYVAGIMGNDTSLLNSVKSAGEKTGEKVWELPLWEEYFDYLKSDIADFKNVGTRAAGTITGGMFLKKFVNDTPWVHMDIAGPTWYEKDNPYIPKGASGFGVRLLVQLLRDWNK